MLADLLLKRRSLVQLHAIDRKNHISLADTGLRGSAPFGHTGDINAAQLLDPRFLAHLIDEILIYGAECQT